MNRTAFVVRNLRYHRLGNLAVLLGAAVGAAVLTGALLVGDSLRGSLRQRTERQLGSVETVLIGSRFLRADLAGQLPGRVRGALLLQGTVHAGAPEGERRAGKVTVWGVNRSFGIDRPELDGEEPVAILSANLAKALQVKAGDTVTVGVQKASALPRSSLLSRRGISDSTRTIKLKVTAILTDSDPANAFSLSNSPTLPSNMFIPVARLQQEIGQEGRINALLGSGESAHSLQSALRSHLSLDDWGLSVQIAPFRKSYISVESNRLLLEPSVVEAVQKTAQELELRSAKTYVYLANSIALGKEAEGIPYSVVAALDPTEAEPLGPFLPEGVSELNPGEIVLVDWEGSPIKPPQKANQPVTVRYFRPEIEGKIEEAEQTFALRGFLKLEGAADDRDLTPPFPGITDRASVRRWDPPFPFDQARIHDADEAYWKKYRATPKAYIRLDDGQKLWGTRFGNVTSIRVAPKAVKLLPKEDLAISDQPLRKKDGTIETPEHQAQFLRAIQFHRAKNYPNALTLLSEMIGPTSFKAPIPPLEKRGWAFFNLEVRREKANILEEIASTSPIIDSSTTKRWSAAVQEWSIISKALAPKLLPVPEAGKRALYFELYYESKRCSTIAYASLGSFATKGDEEVYNAKFVGLARDLTDLMTQNKDLPTDTKLKVETLLARFPLLKQEGKLEAKLLEKTRAEFADRLLTHLDPETGGLIFQPIRQRMLEAGQGSTDFGMLFLAFSFFLIVAALMLVGLLFRLNLDRRAKEIGLLRASGFPLRTVRRLLLIEGLLLAVVGSLIGLGGAILYADLMIRLLVDLWPTAGVDTYLALHVTPLSLGIGFCSSILMSGLAILWALRSLNRVSPSRLLKGDTNPPLAASRSPGASGNASPSKNRASAKPRAAHLASASFVAAIGIAISAPSLPPGEAQAGAFFGSGALLLTAGMCLLWAWLKRTHHHLVSGHGLAALAKLGSRNAVRNPMRSLLTAGLLASAAFLLVAVESFRREPEKDFAQKAGGSGGFALLAEATTPIDFDPNDEDGRNHIEEGLKRHYQEIGLSGDERTTKAAADLEQLKGTTIFRFRLQGGDDASCLNLYQASRPRLLGVPGSLVERGGFSFADTLGEKENPWRLLVLPRDPADGIPCIVEQNTAMWMLKKGLGDTFEVPDENNRPLKLRIVALLKDSVFQSEVLIPDAAFHDHFPHTEGFGYFLLDTPPERAADVFRVLTTALDNYGLETSKTRDRVAAYLAVQNTYLTTFQLLGGFGLLLGVLGLSVVLLRSIWERRAELALLRALGYRVRDLNGIVLAENGLLLVLGLSAGVLAALAAVAPHIASGGQIPWLRLGVMLGLVFVVGLSVAFLAVVTTLRAPLIPALRKE